MSFTFIHTADWQLGRPFKAFDERIAGLLDAARFEAIDRIAAIARGRNAEHVLVAGDVFDAPGLEAKILRKALERLRKHEAVRWHLLPGNHDHVRPGGLWARLAEIGLPGNVAVHDTAKPSEIAPAVTLLPAPLGARAMSADPTAWMDSCATPAGHLRIGLAHGSIRDFGTAEQSAVRIDPARARRAGLAYLALGDWHGKLRIDDRTWYSGTPEPDRFPDNEPGHVLVVRLAVRMCRSLGGGGAIGALHLGTRGRKPCAARGCRGDRKPAGGARGRFRPIGGAAGAVGCAAAGRSSSSAELARSAGRACHRAGVGGRGSGCQGRGR